jgi:hypothetical protein
VYRLLHVLCHCLSHSRAQSPSSHGSQYNLVDFIEAAAPFNIGAVIKAFDKPLCSLDIPPQSCAEMPSVCDNGGQCSGSWACQYVDPQHFFLHSPSYALLHLHDRLLACFVLAFSKHVWVDRDKLARVDCFVPTSIFNSSENSFTYFSHPSPLPPLPYNPPPPPPLSPV